MFDLKTFEYIHVGVIWESYSENLSSGDLRGEAVRGPLKQGGRVGGPQASQFLRLPVAGCGSGCGCGFQVAVGNSGLVVRCHLLVEIVNAWLLVAVENNPK